MRPSILVSRRRALASLLVGTACVACHPTVPGGAALGPAGPANVIGTLAVVVGNVQTRDTSTVELPDAELFLEDSAHTHVAGARSQLDGRFRLRAPGGGTYTVCWKAPGFAPGCGPRVDMRGADQFVGVVPIRSEKGVVFGRALTGDGRPCWVNDPFFQLDVSTRVTLLDASGTPVGTGTRANVFGEYALGGVAPGSYTVVAQCEAARQRAAAVTTGGPVAADLTLPNHAPRLDAVAASQAGHGVTGASVGATVTVTADARDADGDAVEFLWRAPNGTGTLSGGSGPQQSWTLGGGGALHTLYLIARDGRGGYAYKRFDLPVGAAGIAFSGIVVDETTQAPVAGARVEVGGTTATTGPTGWFSLSVPPATPARYVLNVRHPQYALLSRVHDRAAAGNTYELIRVQTSMVDPSHPIDVYDSLSSGPCGTPRQKDGQTPCRRRGARLVLPAGALVDAAGNAPAGPVTLAMATLNPSRRALPGDYRAVDRRGTPAEMLSFGAVYAEFRGPGGAPLKLRAGSPAQVEVPVSDAQRSSAAPSIAIWSYDERRGFWMEEGQANLQSTPRGWMYVGTTTHFSTLNMDVAGGDPAQATCVRLELGASLAGWTNRVLRAYVSYAGTSVQVKETALDGAQYHAVFRIPYAPPAPPPNTLRLEVRGTYAGQQVVLLDRLIATDAPRPKMTGTNLWPPYPYAECGVPVVLEADPVNLPFYGYDDATGRPFFLTGPYGTFLPVDGDAEATAYYHTIDPSNAFPNLQAWWTGHGFAADGSGGTRASYLNYNDLGFGRDMNCRTTGSDLACYVTNYGAPDQNPANADAAAAQDASKRLATVAMEYRASEPADRRVRFWVYNGGNPATAGVLKFADLDGMGPKPVPHLCTVCHGGEYDPTAGVQNALRSRFREFDLPSFRYTTNRSWDYAPAPSTLTASELAAFASLNQMVHTVSPGTSAIRRLIDAWYPSGFGGGPAPVKPAVPAGWVGHENEYHDVYGRSCRTCHIARDNDVAPPTPNFYLFDTYAHFQSTASAVCDSPKVMPNAYVTYRNFWSDATRVIDYRAIVGRTAANCH